MRPLENFLGTFLLYSYIWTFLGAHCALLGPIVPKLKCRPDFFCIFQNFIIMFKPKKKKVVLFVAF